MFGPMHRYVPGLILGVRTYANTGNVFVPCVGTCMSSSWSHSQLSAWVVLARLDVRARRERLVPYAVQRSAVRPSDQVCASARAHTLSVFSSVQFKKMQFGPMHRYVTSMSATFSSVQFSSVQLFICRQVGSHQVHDVKALHTYQCAIFVHKHEACTYVHVHVYAWCALRRTDVHVYGN